MKRILIVEDDADVAAIERDYLELGSYAVTIAPDGTTGLEQTLSQDFDLLLLDVMLPGVSGRTIAFILGFYERFLNALHDLFQKDNTVRKAALVYLAKPGITTFHPIAFVLGVGVLLALEALKQKMEKKEKEV